MHANVAYLLLTYLLTVPYNIPSVQYNSVEDYYCPEFELKAAGAYAEISIGGGHEGVGSGEGIFPSPVGRGLGRGSAPPQKNFPF